MYTFFLLPAFCFSCWAFLRRTLQAHNNFQRFCFVIPGAGVISAIKKIIDVIFCNRLREGGQARRAFLFIARKIYMHRLQRSLQYCTGSSAGALYDRAILSINRMLLPEQNALKYTVHFYWYTARR